MVIVLVRTVRRPGSDDAEYAAAGKRMVELASAMPGFVSYESLVYFPVQKRHQDA